VIESVGIIGGGAWGTALALVAARAGRRTTLFARNPATVAAINQRRENPAYLPGVTLDAPVAGTSDLGEALAADAVFLAVPAQTVRAVVGSFGAAARPGTRLVIAAKGLERGTGKRLTAIVAELAPGLVPAVLSGPSFAGDVARRLPTAVTIAAADGAVATELCVSLGGPSFRPYAETDVVGVEIGGGVKNVLAIAAGIVAGRKLGSSALAALVARGFAELRRLAEALGARPETLMGLSGLGDLVLTCSGPQSRNFSYGMALGEGHPVSSLHPLAEGVATAGVARDLARNYGIEMPITEAVADVLAGTLTIEAAIDRLMSRPLRREAN